QIFQSFPSQETRAQREARAERVGRRLAVELLEETREPRHALAEPRPARSIALAHAPDRLDAARRVARELQVAALRQRRCCPRVRRIDLQSPGFARDRWRD